MTVNSFNILEFLFGLALHIKPILFIFGRIYILNTKNALRGDDVRPSFSFWLSMCDLMSGTKSFLGSYCKLLEAFFAKGCRTSMRFLKIALVSLILHLKA